ncbi:MAG: hypothetical protein ACJAZG_002293, partial [Granulosicoccus sp.]
MAKFHVDQSAIINKPINEVQKYISDFHTW